MAQMVKNLPAKAGDRGFRPSAATTADRRIPIQSRYTDHGEGHGHHSGILAWRILQTEKPGRCSPQGSQRVRRSSATNFLSHVYTFVNTHLMVHLTRTHFIVSLNLFSYLFHQTVTCQRQKGNRIQF